jgi:hypothetical protein
MKQGLMTKMLWAGIALLAISTVASAQSGLVFSSAAEATALDYQKSWTAATHTTESLDLIDWGVQKGNSLSVEGHEITASPFNAYFGGVRYSPDLSALFAKTNLPADSFQIFIQGAGGLATFTANNQIALLFGGGASYRITPNLQWSTLDIHFMRVGSNNAIEMTSGLAYYFNPQATKSMALRRMILHRAMIKAATAGIK